MKMQGNRIVFFAGDEDNFTFVTDIISHYRQKDWDVQVVEAKGLSVEKLYEYLQWADVAWFEWGNGPIIASSRLPKVCKIVCRVHRYEIYSDEPKQINWINVDHLILVSEFMLEEFRVRIYRNIEWLTHVSVINNAVDTEKFTLRQDSRRNFKIGHITRMHPVKNIGLTLQIMHALVKVEPRYKCFIVGSVQDDSIFFYYKHLVTTLGLEQHVFFEGKCLDVNSWLEDKSFILSSSIIESQGVSILEGMAKGLKPVVHNWYGAPEQFYPEENIFSSVQDAVDIILSEDYHPDKYRTITQSRFSYEVFWKKINALIEGAIVPSISNLKEKTGTFFSIVIFTYNRAEYLSDAIQSVLNQGYENFELIVADDGSSDNTEAIVKGSNDERIKYFYKPHTNAPDTRNYAIKKITGDYVIWLGDDDLLLPGLLISYATLVNEFPSVDVFYNNLVAIDLSNNVTSVIPYLDYYKTENFLPDMLQGSPIPDGGSLIKTNLYQRLGKYNAGFKRAHDYEFWSRQPDVMTVKHAGNLGYLWRRHDTNMSHTTKLDLSYDILICKSLVSKYSFQTLFPNFDWSSPETALKQSFIEVSERFNRLQDSESAKCYLALANKDVTANHVLFVNHDFITHNYAGVEVYTFNLAKELISTGLNVSVFYPVLKKDVEMPYVETVMIEGIICHQMNIANITLMSMENDEVERLFNIILSRYTFDIIHFQHIFKLPLSLLSIAKRYTEKLLFTAHDHYLICPRINLVNSNGDLCSGPNVNDCSKCLKIPEPNIGVWYAQVKEEVRNIDILISPSRYLAEKMEGSLKRMATVIPLGVQAIDIISGAKHSKIIYLGSLMPLKGVHDLISAYIQSGIKLPLEIWGDSALDDYKQRMVDLTQKNKKISFKGIYNHSMLADILSSARVVVVPSYIESYCLVVREALIAGIPVIASKTGGIPEIVKHGVNGYLFQAGDVSELAGLISLFSDKESASALSIAQIEVKTVKQELSELLKLYLSTSVSKTHAVPDAYNQYLEKYISYQTKKARQKVFNQSNKVEIEFILKITRQDIGLLAGTLRSLSDQINKNWKLRVLADFDVPDGVIEQERAITWSVIDVEKHLSDCINIQGGYKWMVIFIPGMQLESYFTSLLAEYIEKQPTIDFFYTDHDVLTSQGQLVNPNFKPGFNRDLLFSSHYIGDFCVVNTSVLEKISDFNSVYDLMLKTYECFGERAFYHIPEVLVHVPEQQLGHGKEFIKDALMAYFRRQGDKINFHEGWSEGSFHLQYPVQGAPLVTIIIYMPDNVALLQICLDSLVEKTIYNNYQIVMVCNHKLNEEGSAHLEKLKAIESGRLSVIELDSYGNVSQALNKVASSVSDGYLLFLDGVTEIVQPDWLEEMLSQAQRQEAGVVGARLLSGEFYLKNAGMILGMGSNGIVGLPHNGLSMNDQGYQERALFVQNFSAVTLACLMIEKRLYQQVGGLDEDKFKVLYNDVDLCLKVRELGYKIVWTPYVTLIHHGSSSLKKVKQDKKRIEQSQQEVNGMLEKWLPQLANDPAYNRNLSLKTTDFQVDTSMNVAWNVDFKDKPRIYAFPANSSGVGEYRVRAPLRGLTQAGLVESSLANNMDQLIFPTPVEIERIKPDVLLIQNGFLDWMLEPWKKYRKFNDVFMVSGQDDLVYMLPNNHPMKGQWPKNTRRKLKEKFQCSDRVIVANEALAAEFSKLTDDIIVVPNYLEKARWSELAIPEKQIRKKLRVGWAGGQEHIGDLAFILPVVEALHKEVDWVFMGLCPDKLMPFVKEAYQGVEFDLYPQQLANLGLDLAIAPLEHNKFNECKTNLRLLEFGVLAWPIVCSDILPYQNAPVTRVANNVEHWIKVLREKIDDPDELRKEGVLLQRWVMENYMLDDHLDEWFVALMP